MLCNSSPCYIREYLTSRRIELENIQRMGHLCRKDLESSEIFCIFVYRKNLFINPNDIYESK